MADDENVAATDAGSGDQQEVTDTPAVSDETPTVTNTADEQSPAGGEQASESQAGDEAEPVNDQPPGGEEENPTEEAVPEAEGQAVESGEGNAEEAHPVENGEVTTEGAPDGDGGEESVPTDLREEEKTELDENNEQVQSEAGEAVPEGSVEIQVQSDAFSEGERAESPVAIGEKLSREGSPVQDVEYTQRPYSPAQLRPETPEQPASYMQEDDEDEEDEDFDDDQEYDGPEINRDELIEKYQATIAERELLQQKNYQLQHKLAEYFKKKKSDDNRQDVDKNVTDQEQRYLKYMANLDELRRQETGERDNFKYLIEEMREKCQEKQDIVDQERGKYMEFKKTVALNAINSRSGKPIPPKDIDQYLGQENKKEQEVVNVRLENIKLKNKLKKTEQQLKSKEELAEGLHLIDFEQLKIENQTYNEKIEERNEELLKLRKKITSTVQVLTHLKEKLQFVQAENYVQKGRLREVEDYAAKKRDILTKTKQARDALRIDNHKLRQNCGLLGNEPLLRDFENRKDESDDLKNKLEELKISHAELTLNCNGIRRKIEQAKTGRS